MKKLLIGLMLIGGAAHAEKYFELPNKAGGKIVLHANACHDKSKPSLRLATVSSPNSKTDFACWGYFGGEVHIIYEDGERRAYRGDAFTYVDTDNP